MDDSIEIKKEPDLSYIKEEILAQESEQSLLIQMKEWSRMQLIYDAAKRYGDQCVVISADVKRVDGVFRVFAKGGRENTGMEAVEWIKRCVGNGAGEVVLNSIDTDGVKKGFDIEMLDAVCNAVSVPVIASGGAGGVSDFVELFKKVPKVDAGLAASIFHFGEVAIKDLKAELRANGIDMRI